MCWKKRKKIDLAIVGIGNPFMQSTLEEIGYIGDDELKSLEASGVVGDINSCFICRDGTIAKKFDQRAGHRNSGG